MRKPLILLAALITLQTAIAAADSIRADGFNYKDDVTIVGLKKSQLQVRINGQEKLFDLAKVESIEITGQPDFNNAEQNRKDPEKARDAYRAQVERLNMLKDLTALRAASLPKAEAKTATPPAGAETKKDDNASKFFGVETRGKSVVYILDHSGSMLDNFDFLRQEAQNAVNKIPEDTTFNAIMVSEEASVMFDKPQPATAEQKKAFATKIAGYRAQGSNDDLLVPFKEAFEKAFAMKPDTIYFLTDGHFDPRLAAVIEKLNKDKKTHINTLAFINKEPSYEQQLKDIAKNNGGTYKFVSEKDLGIPK